MNSNLNKGCKFASLVSIKDGVRVAIREMELNSISSVFVVDKDKKIQGIVTIDDCIKLAKDKKTSLKDILKQDYYTTTEVVSSIQK